jgi:hypothetical protein
MNRLFLNLTFFVFFCTLPGYSQIDTAWVRMYDAPEDKEHWADALAVDGDGNVYVTGSGGTIKYDSEGNQLWIRSECGYAMTVDSFGNVYVTTGGTLYCFACHTIKYDTDGNQLWVRPWGGYSIATDDSGNVYVAADSIDSSTGFNQTDFATIKYYPDGDRAWIKTYNGPTEGDDDPQAIAVDIDGNVYVTGASGHSEDDMGSSVDYATLKYYPNGDTAWVRRYNGPGNDWDQPCGLAVDDGGNVYVTGWSANFESSSGTEYATIKYYPNGDTAWVRRSCGSELELCGMPSALALDGIGDVYVAGFNFSEDDLGSSVSTGVIMKYDQGGNQLWFRQKIDPQFDSDITFKAMTVDMFGNIYVAGHVLGDLVTLKYDADGNELWAESYGSGNYFVGDLDIAVDSLGSLVYVTGSSYHGDTEGYVTIKYVDTSATDIEETSNNRLPLDFCLEQNYPNPFNPFTILNYKIPEENYVTLRVYNLLGQEIRVLVDELKEPGYYTVSWDGTDSSGKEVASGLYFTQLRAGDFIATRRMSLIK